MALLGHSLRRDLGELLQVSSTPRKTTGRGWFDLNSLRHIPAGLLQVGSQNNPQAGYRSVELHSLRSHMMRPGWYSWPWARHMGS